MSENNGQLSDQSTKQNKPFISPWWGLYILLVLGYPLFFLNTFVEPPPQYGQVPPFVLQDHLGKDFHLGQDKRPLIANFIFTRCQNVCPTLSAKMQYLQDVLDDENALLISITVDPNYDRPEILKEYASQFHNDPAQWLFLTGKEANIRKVIGDFQQLYEPASDEEHPNIMHSEKFILLDEFGMIRGFYDDDPEGMNRLLHELKGL